MMEVSRRFLVATAVGCGMAYAALSLAVHSHVLDGPDLRLNAWVDTHAGDTFLGLTWSTWTLVGTSAMSVAAVGACAFLLVRAGKARTAAILVTFALVGGVLVDGFKSLHGRPYPPHGRYVLGGDGMDTCAPEEWCFYEDGNATVLCPAGTHCNFYVPRDANDTRVREEMRVNQTYVPPDWSRFPSRPGNAYPSGHTMGATLSWGLVLVLGTRALQGRRRLDTWALGAWGVVAFMGGVSRVPLQTHWATDVVGSWFLGVGLLALALLADERWGRGASATAIPSGPPAAGAARPSAPDDVPPPGP